MNNLEVHHFPSYGYLQDRIPEDLYNSLLRYISLEENKKIKYNKELAGQIEEEYFLSNIDEEFYIKLEKYLLDLVDVYDDIFKYNSRYKISINNMPFKLGTLWVNYQKKYEYNPIHDHSGVYSFVIWIKIPYNLKDEEKNPSSINSSRNTFAEFSFHYINNFGQIVQFPIKVDENYEGNIVLFPSELKHSVTPFYTSNEFRISVSGNIMCSN
jgi:hypothetical protein